MEKKIEVKTYQLEYYCDQCKSEPMRFTGRTMYIGRDMYEHQCPLCGFRKNLVERYPKIVYKKLEIE